jgi:hypothetical protein
VALPLSEIRNQLKKQKMSIPNIAKEDIINAFQFRHATKGLMLQDDNRR